jgi:hypothetical protein
MKFETGIIKKQIVGLLLRRAYSVGAGTGRGIGENHLINGRKLLKNDL